MHHTDPVYLPQVSHPTQHHFSNIYAQIFPVEKEIAAGPLARSSLELLAEHKELSLVVDGEHTGTSDTTENVGSSTLEQRLDTFLSNDLATSIKRGLVFDSL